jgi:hypothetical protein
MTDHLKLTQYKDEKEAERLWIEISKRKTFIYDFDNRDADLPSDKAIKAEEKYKRYEKELVELESKFRSLEIIED